AAVKTPTLQQLLDGPRAPGELVVVAHPLGFKNWDNASIAGMEIYDLADNFMPPSVWRTAGRMTALAARALGVRLFGRSTRDILIDRLERPDAQLKKWDEQLARGRHIAGFGAPDAHQNMRMFGVQLDRYAETLRFPAVHILAGELTAQALAAALKSGRSYTAFDLIADPRGFEFIASDDAGLHAQGDAVPMPPGRPADLTARLPREARIRLFKNGELVQETSAAELSYTAREPGAYRVEAELNVRGKWKPWIYSNPIYLESSK
ncbi:MAG: hypothetical protein HY925_02805, partial [Elusimicrobia bacterium]|nr:hypothetical protein [Elusimicrobiota bacterium]